MNKDIYETEELRHWILNEEFAWNKVNRALNSFEGFCDVVKSIIATLNNIYEFLNFKFYEIDFKSLYDYFNHY